MAIVCKWCGHPGQQSAMGGKINILMTKIEFLHSTNFKLRQIKGNSINVGHILKILMSTVAIVIACPRHQKT